jgi:hypothetical protein
MLAWLERRGGTLDDFVFPSRIDQADHSSTRQYARLVDEWVTGIGLRQDDYGTHSLRRTKASIIYKQTGNLRAVQILLGHTKIESTVRYLEVDIEDALALSEGTEVQRLFELLDLTVGKFCAINPVAVLRLWRSLSRSWSCLENGHQVGGGRRPSWAINRLTWRSKIRAPA